MPRRRGRPPSPRGVLSFEEVFPPSELVLDTSFVFDALVPNQPRHAACQEFLARIAEADSTVYFNRLLEAELWEISYKVAIRERHDRGDWRKLRLDGRCRRRAKTLQRTVETAWRDALRALDWSAIDLAEVEPWISEAMGWGLSSYDAVHASTAIYADVPAILTLDSHFGIVPRKHADIYVPTNRLAPTRRHR